MCRVFFLAGQCWDWHCLTSWLAIMGSGIESTVSRFAVTHWRESSPARETLTGLRDGPVHSCGSSTRPSARFCVRIRKMPGTNTVWPEIGLQTAPQRNWDCWWMRNLTRPGNVLFILESQTRPELHPAWPAGQGRWFSPSTLLSWVFTWRIQLWNPQHKKDVDLLEQAQK